MYNPGTNMYYKTELPKQDKKEKEKSHENTPYTTTQKQPKEDKLTKTKIQHHRVIHSTWLCSDCYKSKHIKIPINHTNTKTILIIIK